jgi:hypothetical protein
MSFWSHKGLPKKVGLTKQMTSPLFFRLSINLIADKLLSSRA